VIVSAVTVTAGEEVWNDAEGAVNVNGIAIVGIRVNVEVEAAGVTGGVHRVRKRPKAARKHPPGTRIPLNLRKHHIISPNRLRHHRRKSVRRPSRALRSRTDRLNLPFRRNRRMLIRRMITFRPLLIRPKKPNEDSDIVLILVSLFVFVVMERMFHGTSSAFFHFFWNNVFLQLLCQCVYITADPQFFFRYCFRSFSFFFFGAGMRNPDAVAMKAKK